MEIDLFRLLHQYTQYTRMQTNNDSYSSPPYRSGVFIRFLMHRKYMGIVVSLLKV